MKIVALIIGIMLVSAGVGGAIDKPIRTVAPAMPAVQDGMPYTGVIQNKTNCLVSIPSDNSDATLTIPPHGWIEYTIWTHQYDTAAYYKGDPFYCLKLIANPQAYTFKCKKYDFMAEIVGCEPVIKHWPSKLKHRKIKRKVKKSPEC